MIFVDALSYGVVFPILPQLLFNHQMGLILDYSAYRAYFYSITIAIYPLAEFFSMSFFGIVSDKYGRRLMLIVGLITLVFSYFLAALSIIQHNFILFLLCRALSGFCGGIYSVGNAIASDISGADEKDKLSHFKLPSMAGKLGLTIGPALSIFVISNDYFSNEFVIPYLIISIFGCFNILLLIYNFKYIPNKKAQGNVKKIKWTDLFAAVYHGLKKKNLRLLLISFIFFQCGSSLFIQALSFYLTVEYQYSPAQIGVFSSVMACILLFSTWKVAQFLSQRYSCQYQLKIMLISLIGLFFYAIVINRTNGIILHVKLVRFWCLAGLFYLALPQIRLCFTTLSSIYADKYEQGLIMGAAGQITAFSYFISGLFVGHIVLHHHTLIITCILLLISFLLFMLFLSQRTITSSKNNL